MALADPAISKSLSSSPAPSRTGSETEHQSHAKKDFERNVRRYYYQLTIGCQHNHCTNRLCRSCPASPKMSKDAAAILAVQLAARPRLFFCCYCPVDPTMSVPDSPLHIPSGNTSTESAAHTRRRNSSTLCINTKLSSSSSRSSPGLGLNLDEFGRTKENRLRDPTISISTLSIALLGYVHVSKVNFSNQVVGAIESYPEIVFWRIVTRYCISSP
ncbi:hypothetical protein BGZ83_007188 [Gryganskiella cystojenkinii]|nr:hypothetical protein BGZ83_007188 [Gryganskiella cystojenkinii]